MGDPISSSPCNLCPRECGVNRRQGQLGYCRRGERILVARAALHPWEEPCISGSRGSGTVFFAGCNLRCVYCQNYEIAAEGKGYEVSIKELADIFLSLQEQGAENINLVTPDHYLIDVAEAVRLAKKAGLRLPIVWNVSGYEKKEAIESLSGIADIFLTDFKYMESELAARLSSAPDYPQVAKTALKAMVKLAGEPVFDENGMLKKGVVVRHLLLPGHKRNARAVIRYVYQAYGDRVILSLMNQYTPFERLRDIPGCEELCRKVTAREYEAVVDYALSLGVENAYIQEGGTAKESFIPAFNGEGLGISETL